MPLIVLLIVALIAAFAIAITGSWLHGAIFTVGVLGVFALLGLIARGGALLMRRLAPSALPFAWRQGLAESPPSENSDPRGHVVHRPRRFPAGDVIQCAEYFGRPGHTAQRPRRSEHGAL